MLSVSFQKQRTVQLPKKQNIEKTSPMYIPKVSSGNLSESSKFEPETDGVAFTPPDKNFMQNLYSRMEKA